MDRISQTMPPHPHLPSSSTSLNLFVCCTCLLDAFQPCLSPFALSIPKSPSLPTSRPFLFFCLAWIAGALMLNLERYFSKTWLRLNKEKPPHPCLSSLIYLFEKSVRPSLESRHPLLSPMSLLTLLRLPKCQRLPFPSRMTTLELTAFSNVELLFTILLACSGFNIISSAIWVPAAAGGAISQHGLHYTPPISNRFFFFFRPLREA